MGTSEQRHKKYAAPWQIVLMVIGFVVMTPIYALTITILLSLFVISPILEHFDQTKFKNVDSFSRSLHEKLSDTSNGAEKWKYTKECTPDRTGWMETGKFLCSATSRTQTEITELSDLKSLHEKYLSIVDESSYLKSKDFTVFYPTIFGIKFQVSSVVKRYDYKTENDIVCTFQTQLDQPDEDAITTEYGDDILGINGQVNISFNCVGVARGDWYK
jgi:hypothetical protein